MRFLCLALFVSTLQSVAGRRIKARLPKHSIHLHDGDERGTRVTNVSGVPIYKHKSAATYTRGASLLQLEEHVFRWILILKTGVSKERLERFCEMQTEGTECGSSSKFVPFVILRGTETEIEILAASHSDIILFVETDSPTHSLPEMPNQETTIVSDSWALGRIGGLPRRPDQGKGVHIYVLDGGVRANHSDFGGRVVPTLEVTSRGMYVCCENCSEPCNTEDDFGHGTHCAGIAAGSTYGLAPGATIHAVKVTEKGGRVGEISWLIQAIRWIVLNGERPAVLSISLGFRERSMAAKAAIDEASNEGFTVFVSAGNDNKDACRQSPAFVPSAITVGSVGPRTSKSISSSFGPCVKIFAPGENIRSADSKTAHSFKTMSGTSMATPLVAGAAALFLESHKDSNSNDILEWLLKHALTGVISGVPNPLDSKLLFIGANSTSQSLPQYAIGAPLLNDKEALQEDVCHGVGYHRVLAEAECKEAAAGLGWTYGGRYCVEMDMDGDCEEEYDEESPRGCYVHRSTVYFNPHSVGAPQDGKWIICVRS